MAAEPARSSELVALAKQALLEQAVAFVGGQTPDEEARFLERVSAVLAETSEEELYEAVQRLQSVGSTWGYHAPNAFARRMHHAMGDVAVRADSTVRGLEHLDACGSAPLLFLPNHLSYSDANLFQILLARGGRDDIASRLTVIAGPKVYSEVFRRFSALCFGTIKTPQSSSLASGEALMSAREVATLALETMAKARKRLDAGDALLVFAEGTRSRSATMQPTLAAIARYFDYPDLRLVPVGIAGSERLIPVDEARARPTRVEVSVGRPLDARGLLERTGGRKRLAMDVVGLAIAAELPAPYRGAYSGDATELAEARAIASSYGISTTTS